jgi:hypothetical protein
VRSIGVEIDYEHVDVKVEMVVEIRGRAKVLDMVIVDVQRHLLSLKIVSNTCPKHRPSHCYSPCYPYLDRVKAKRPWGTKYRPRTISIPNPSLHPNRN